jgi:biopolymer transport protein ExbB
MRNSFFYSVLVLLSLAEARAQGYAAWQHHRNITLNTSSTGAGVTANVDKFPVAINLNSGNFDFSQAKADGSDLRFSKTDG